MSYDKDKQAFEELQRATRRILPRLDEYKEVPRPPLAKPAPVTIGLLDQGWITETPAPPPSVRKGQPLATGVLAYFPDALTKVSEVSQAGSDQHHPGKPLHWDRNKSMDHADCLLRHLRDHLTGNPIDTDGQPHLGKVAWRALALLQVWLEEKG